MKFKHIFYLLIILFTYSAKSQSIIPNSPAFTMFTVTNVTDTGATLSGAILNFSAHIATLTQNVSQNAGVYNPNTFQTTYPNINFGFNFKIVPTITISMVLPGGGVYQFSGDTLRINRQNFFNDTIKFKIKLKGLEPNVAYCSNYNLQGFFLFGCDTATNNKLNSYANLLYSQSYAPTAYNYNNPPPKLPLGYSASFSQSLGNFGYPPQVIFTTSISPNPNPKPKLILPDTIYSFPPPYYLNPIVYGNDTLGIDSIFDVSASSAKIAFHFKFVALSKRLNFNLAAGKSFTLRPIAGNYLNDKTTITGNTVTINKSNFSTNGVKISFVVSLNGIKPSANNLASIFYAVNIFSNPKEGVFADYQSVSNLLNVIPSVSNFTFALSEGKIQGNILPSQGKIICAKDSIDGVVYYPGIISAPAPTGGFGNYNYLWQKRTPGGFWENCPSSGNEDYVIPGFKQAQLKSTEEYYRRIVTSSQAKVNQVYSDTSNVFKVVYITSTNLPFVTIEQVGINGKAPLMQIVTNHQNSVLHYNVTDINSRAEAISHTQYSEFFTIPNTITAYEHSYNISVKFNGTCPVFNTKEIFVSKPDGNGNIYPVIKIRNQYWIINNLRATCFNDGTPIANITNTVTQNKANYTWYNNDSLLNALPFGALYNATVINNDAEKNVCPVNWRVAGFADWDLLVQNTGGYLLSGDSLKLPMDWSGFKHSKTSINFNASPSGEFIQMGNGTEYDFVGKNEIATWWGIIPDLKVDPPRYNANYFEITNKGGAIILNTAKYGPENDKVKHSIRCVTNVIK